MNNIIMIRRDTGGEGSRGGTVVGRTHTGKPIYDNHSHPDHAKFSIVEHQKAASIHEQKAVSAREVTRNAKDPGIRAKGEERAKNHDTQAALHTASSKARRKPTVSKTSEQVKAATEARGRTVRARFPTE